MCTIKHHYHVGGHWDVYASEIFIARDRATHETLSINGSIYIFEIIETHSIETLSMSPYVM